MIVDESKYFFASQGRRAGRELPQPGPIGLILANRIESPEFDYIFVCRVK